MKNFNWEEFKKGKTVVHCDTEEKAKDFVKKCHEHNLEWYTPNINATHYNLTNTYGYNGCLTGAQLDYYKYRNYKIIYWEIEKMTNAEKILDVIGLKVGEKFKIDKCYETYTETQYHFDERLNLRVGNKIFSDYAVNILNGQLQITKLPTITDNDKEILNFYAKRGYKWFACDKDGELDAYKEKPYKAGRIYRAEKHIAYFLKLPEPLSFLKWEDEPFYWE